MKSGLDAKPLFLQVDVLIAFFKTPFYFRQNSGMKWILEQPASAILQ